MKRGVIFLFLLMGHLSFAQPKRVDFSSIDWKVQSVDAPTPDSLAKKLTEGYGTDLEKVRSIFRWITEHIEYKVVPKVSARYHYIKRWEDTTMEWRGGEEMSAWAVLQKRTAFCEGYAKLFKTLCSYAGIRSEIVTGYARTNDRNRFSSNHSWNAVYIDSNWYLLDATWASGHISYRTEEFVKAYDDFFFLTTPSQLIKTHYPEDIRWTLLDNVPDIHEFRRSPFKHSNFVKYSIKSFFPEKGTIEAVLGDTIEFELSVSNVERDQQIGSNPFFDSSILAAAKSSFLYPFQVDKKKIVYRFVIDSPDKEWLHLVYNHDIILQYRLRINNKNRDDVALER